MGRKDTQAVYRERSFNYALFCASFWKNNEDQFLTHRTENQISLYLVRKKKKLHILVNIDANTVFFFFFLNTNLAFRWNDVHLTKGLKLFRDLFTKQLLHLSRPYYKANVQNSKAKKTLLHSSIFKKRHYFKVRLCLQSMSLMDYFSTPFFWRRCYRLYVH